MKPHNRAYLVALLLPMLILFSSLKPSNLKAEEVNDIDVLAAAQNSAYEKAKQGYLTDALVSANEALKTAESRYGPEHPSIVPPLIDVANLKRTLALYTDSESDFKWGLAIRERSLGPKDPLIAESLEQLAGLYNDWGRWEEAEALQKRALSIRDENGDEKLSILSLNRLADNEINLKKYSQAVSVLKQSLNIQEKQENGVPGPKNEALGLLAQAFQSSPNRQQAELYLKKAVETAKKSLGLNSLEYCDALTALANYQKTQGYNNQALTNYRQAREVYSRFAGTGVSNPAYPLLPYMIKLAKTEFALGNDLVAHQLWEKIGVIGRQVYGPHHPQVALTLMNLAEVEKNLGKTRVAKEHLNDALAIFRSFFGENYPLVQKVRMELNLTK